MKYIKAIILSQSEWIKNNEGINNIFYKLVSLSLKKLEILQYKTFVHKCDEFFAFRLIMHLQIRVDYLCIWEGNNQTIKWSDPSTFLTLNSKSCPPRLEKICNACSGHLCQKSFINQHCLVAMVPTPILLISSPGDRFFKYCVTP